MTSTVFFTALAVALAVPSPPRSRLLGALGQPRRRRSTPLGRLLNDDVWSSPTLAAVLAGLGVAWFVEGTVGLVGGMVAAVIVRRWVGALESGRQRRRRQRVERDLPLAVDLTVAALAAGRPPIQALEVVGAAVGGPVAEELATITARLDLGADPELVWHEAAQRPGMRPLGRAFARATQAGVSITVVLGRCAEDLRAVRRSEVQRTARTVGVHTAAPLGACFLPAFIVVGIVPALVGAFDRFVL